MPGWRTRAIFHAEANVLLRASEGRDGKLAGVTTDVTVNRPICYCCMRFLPYLAYELGNPKLTFIDPTGARRVIHDKTIRPADKLMPKYAYFASRDYDGWPRPEEIEPYFLGRPGRTWFAPKQRWFFETGNDTAGFKLEGAEGTGHLEFPAGRIDIELLLWGDPQHGVLLIWSKVGGGHNESYVSMGDLNKGIRKWVRTLHDDPNPIGMYIPFEDAWKAVKEFIESEGALPKSIEWLDEDCLPEDTFPDQHDIPKV